MARGAFSQTVMACCLVPNINWLSNRLVNRHMREIPVTPYDLHNMLVPEEHRDTLVKAGKIMEHTYESIRFTWIITSPMDTVVELHATLKTVKHGEFLPLFPPKGYQRNTHSAFDDWLREYITILRDFSRLSAVMCSLNTWCTSPQQVRGLLPGVITLLDMDSDYVPVADKIRDLKRTNNPASLPQPLKIAVKKAATTIASASLLDNYERPRNSEVQISLYTPIHYDEDGFVFNATS